MRRKLWITVSSFLMLIMGLSMSQPNENLAQLKRLQTHLIELYEQYRQNASAVELEYFMDSLLMTRTNGIIDLIRGWSRNASEESINVRTSMDYLRSNVLYACIVYVDSWYDSCLNAGNLDADITLHALEIYQIRSNFSWINEPSDQIVSFELAQFFQFRVRARVLNNMPYVRFFSTCTESARFFDDMFAPSAGFSFFSVNFMPLRRNPQINLLREVAMLMDAQNVVLDWNDLRNERSTILRNQLYFLNEKLRRILQELINSLMKECDLTTMSEQNKRTAFVLLSLLVLQRYVRFTLTEYNRHVCHPAHIRYAYVLSANTTMILRENHIRLEHTYQNLITTLNRMTYNNSFLLALYSHASTIPLRVGYVRYDGRLSLRIAISCQNQSEN